MAYKYEDEVSEPEFGVSLHDLSAGHLKALAGMLSLPTLPCPARRQLFTQLMEELLREQWDGPKLDDIAEAEPETKTGKSAESEAKPGNYASKSTVKPATKPWDTKLTTKPESTKPEKTVEGKKDKGKGKAGPEETTDKEDKGKGKDGKSNMETIELNGGPGRTPLPTIKSPLDGEDEVREDEVGEDEYLREVPYPWSNWSPYDRWGGDEFNDRDEHDDDPEESEEEKSEEEEYIIIEEHDQPRARASPRPRASRPRDSPRSKDSPRLRASPQPGTRPKASWPVPKSGRFKEHVRPPRRSTAPPLTPPPVYPVDPLYHTMQANPYPHRPRFHVQPRYVPSMTPDPPAAGRSKRTYEEWQQQEPWRTYEEWQALENERYGSSRQYYGCREDHKEDRRRAEKQTSKATTDQYHYTRHRRS